MDHQEFIERLLKRFPEAVRQAGGAYSRGLIHCEIADFRQVVEEAMDAGRHWRVEQYLRFVAECHEAATPALANAIDVSFVEDFARGEYSAARHQAVRERMPALLRSAIVRVDGRWR